MKGRRVLLYFSWDRRAEISADHGVLEDRYPALFEFRRALWPRAEGLAQTSMFRQDVSGFLDHVVLSDFARFRSVVAEASGYEVALKQRGADDGGIAPIDADLLLHVDTLIVVSLDHRRASGEASPDDREVTVLREFAASAGKRLFLCPHHDIGGSNEIDIRGQEFTHHGDRLVPSRQQLGGYARAACAALGIPVQNRFGLSPGRDAEGGPAALIVDRDADRYGILEGVTTFNLHPHLPHLALANVEHQSTAVLARQALNTSASRHPLFDPSLTHFNAFVQHQFEGGGVAYVCDATLWSSAFGGQASLERLWRNLAVDRA